MNKKTLTLRVIICAAAVALAIGAWINNPAHLFTAGIVFAAGLNAKSKSEEDAL